MDPATAKMALQIAVTVGRSRALQYLVIGLVVVAMLAGLAIVYGPWILTTQLTASLRSNQPSQTTDAGTCPIPTGDADAAGSKFTSEQVGNAKIILSVAQQMSLGERAAVVGIATALQESALRNLSHGDRDSVGLFQQRASWGSRAKRMDPAKSSRLFFNALRQVKGWKQMPVTEAAQAVQVSRFPDAYAKHEKSATGLVALIQSNAKPGTPAGHTAFGSAMCGAADALSCPPTRMPVEGGLTPDALRVLRCIADRWQKLESFGGVGERPSNVDRDHQEGRAVDAMIPDYQTPAGRQLGDTIANWLVTNHEQLGIKYIIWNERIWNVEREAEGWRTCGKQGSCYNGPDDSAAHRDHVHVSVYGNQSGKSQKPGRVVLPVKDYVLTAQFGQCSSHWANCHTGLDFAAPLGTPIRATMSGTVLFTGLGGAYGNLTKIQHGNGVQTWYAHQSATDVKAGDTVTAGQTIGRLGGTGNTTGPHLHLEVRDHGKPVDPDQWLSGRGVTP